MYIFKCKQCDNEFNTRDKRNKFCSRKCFYLSTVKPRIERKCLFCKKKFYKLASKFAQRNGKKFSFCSKKCVNRARVGKYKGENHPRWVGNKIKYFPLHAWIRNNWGHADHCEHCGKMGKPKGISFQWAKIKGKKYHRKRENFMQLCHVCHIRYDNVFNVYHGG